MSAEAEKAGIPSVCIVAPQFVAFAGTSVRAQGVADVALAIMPYDVMTGKTEPTAACEKAAEDIIAGLTRWAPKVAPADAARSRAQELRFTRPSYEAAADSVNRHFLERMWSDGYPLIPPTRERVDWLLRGTELPPQQVIARFPPRNGAITVETIAVNAAMAGARPEYMPVLLAAASALATAAGLKIMHFLTNSVSNQAPVFVINGPIAQELNVNASYGMMGPGWQANATIGRAMSLLLINGAGAYFGSGGNMSCQSTPGRYSWCFAEHEAESPWPALHIERGQPAGSSAISVLPGKGTHLIFLQPPVDHLLNMIAHAVQGVSAREFGVPWDQLLVLSPSHAQAIADAGLNKRDVQDYVFEHARISLEEGEATGFIFRQSPEWAKRVEGVIDRRGTMIPKIEKPEDLQIIVSGGPGCVSSTLIPGLCKMVTADIDRFKPASWDALLAAAADQGGPDA